MAVNKAEFDALVEVARMCDPTNGPLAEIVEKLSYVSNQMKKFAAGELGIELTDDNNENLEQYSKILDKNAESYKEAGSRVIIALNNLMENMRQAQKIAASATSAATEASKAAGAKTEEVQGGTR